MVNKFAGDGKIVDAADLQEVPLPELGPNDVLIKMIAAPINPSDLMTIKGSYKYAPQPPFAVGYEGVAEVVETGKDVKSVAVGDWVLPRKMGMGTWRDYCISSESHFVKLDKSLRNFKAAATVVVNPPTAYYLITESGIKPGQTLIQNGANSMVGKCIIQFCKEMGIKTVNVIRKRANAQELIDELKALGADHVITDDKLAEVVLEEKPVVGIDCVAGEAAYLLMQKLAPGSTLYNYGALSEKPIPVNPTDTIFNNITVKGYHLQRSIDRDSTHMTNIVFPYVGRLTMEGKFKLPEYELFALEDYKTAIPRAIGGFSNKKQLLVMDKSLMD